MRQIRIQTKEPLSVEGSAGMAQRVLTDAPEPPAALLQRARAAFRLQQRRLTQQRQVTAVPQPLAWPESGRRGVPAEEQFLYTTDAYDIDIQCSYDTTSQSFVLQGQILARSPGTGDLAGVEVRLIATQSVRGTKPDRLRLTDALGHFTFSYLVEGEYQLRLLFAEEEVILDTIVVKNKPAGQL